MVVAAAAAVVVVVVVRGGNSNSNKYNPIWHRSQCCGVKWGARVLRVRSVSREEVWAACFWSTHLQHLLRSALRANAWGSAHVVGVSPKGSVGAA